MKEILYKELSYKIVGIAMEIHNELGHGFLEKVYENAMLLLLNESSIYSESQKSIDIYFRGRNVGHYIADILVENQIIVELKSAQGIGESHRIQALNYLKATGIKLALIINFGKDKLEVERVVR